MLRDVRGGDVVTALAHHLQCAWLLAESVPDDLELQIAGLVHDVASSVSPRPAGDHAIAGARLVRPLLGDRVADLVAGHVFAKRYLVTIDPAYRTLLSANSTSTLDAQGDALSNEEREAFEQSPHAADRVRLRRADECAKVPHLLVPDLDHWRPRLEELASTI